MEFNEISMCMDVKLDIYDKRPDSLKFKTWTKCQVKIEAIKCLPCFLRINFQSLAQDDKDESSQLSVSINVPGVTISLATSRTKQHSYGLFWTHNRRDCFIYFALDTEMSCRKHMKWIKKSIKNLELYRQVFLEQRRNSRGSGLLGEVGKLEDKQRELSAVKDALSALGPLPQIPDGNSNINWSRRVSRASDIYEEIFEGNFPPRLSRRLSRTSIASGIYEEMKPCSPNIHSIVEEHFNCPPPLPPLPPHRKRLNTYESDPFSLLGDIPRSNTNPEADLAKKKKYKNVLDNIFGAGRSKRAESVSETPTCTMEDIINGGDSVEQFHPIYANEILKPLPACTKPNKRNSFSSPDLSKINFLDTFDEDKVAAFLHLNSSSDLELHDDFECEVGALHNYSSLSLDDSVIPVSSSLLVMARIHALKSKSGSMESLNVSGQLPQNFNFSACNTSSINLVGASGAVPSIQQLRRNKIVMEDELTGYCVMAPIISKKLESQETTTTTTSSTTSSTTSGYSTGSYSSTSSSTSSNTQVTENRDLQSDIFQKPQLMKRNIITKAANESDYDEVPLRKTPLPVSEADLSNIYENMQTAGSPLNGSSVILRNHENTPPLARDFTGNLYENLLTIKAAQELEQPLSGHICTSTPTDSPADKQSPGGLEEQENFYQTPRKSIISVDDKIPSYYPNSCDTVKMRRRSNSPSKQTTPTTHKYGDKEKSSTTTMGIKHLVNIKMKRERKENLYISSPQKILEQRKKSSTNSCPPALGSTKSKKSANAQKISENVYTVNLTSKKSLQLNNNNSNNNNNISEKTPYNEITETAQLKEKLHTELLQLALLQNIDFKFDDTSTTNTSSNVAATSTANYLKTPPQSGIAKLEQAELEYEHCYQATKDATRLLHKYATLAPKQSMRIKQQLQHHLQLNQSSNKKILMTQSTKLESPMSSSDLAAANVAMGSKKFASLPRFKKIDFSPLKLKINNVLQRNQTPDF
ncbi:uncharacterized protein sced [Calliphora vicina]|uniref:uncharacterized protein sced n=1 Tax=Calliphora vicina TaxID=7373 RepID=UPI00325B99D4